jgi:hypothetical protein
MGFRLQFLLDQARMICLLFMICGLLSYSADYRSAKKKPVYKRERAFSKTVSFMYIFGAAAAYLVLQVVAWVI